MTMTQRKHKYYDTVNVHTHAAYTDIPIHKYIHSHRSTDLNFGKSMVTQGSKGKRNVSMNSLTPN